MTYQVNIFPVLNTHDTKDLQVIFQAIKHDSILNLLLQFSMLI